MHVPGWTAILLKLSHIAGMTATQAQPFVEMGSCERFALVGLELGSSRSQ
jgi:hypothetical protein